MGADTVTERLFGWSDPLANTLGSTLFWLVLGIATVLIVMAVLKQRFVRENIVASEYDEAIGLRRHYVKDGGEVIGDEPSMSVGEAIYIVGIVALDKIVTLAVAAMVIYAVTG